MDLDILRNFNINDSDYLQVAKELKSINLTEGIRKAIDYSILQDNIEHLLEQEQRWNTYYNLVVASARELLIESANIIHNKLPHIEIQTLKLYIVYHSIYKTFTGFEFEHNVIEQLIKDGYIILADNVELKYNVGSKVIDSTFKQYLDSKFAIDLRAISPSGQLIGIQFKSESYLNLDFKATNKYGDTIKAKHNDKHNKAKNNGLCQEVYFIFHRANSMDILRLDSSNYYYDKLEQDYLITSYLVTTTNKYDSNYVKHKDFKDRKKAY